MVENFVENRGKHVENTVDKVWILSFFHIFRWKTLWKQAFKLLL